MPRIGSFPPFGKRLYRRARKLVGSWHFAHFWRAVVSLAAMQGRRNMRKLEASCRNSRNRQAIGFLRWRPTRPVGASCVWCHYLNRWRIEVLFKESKQFWDWATTNWYGTGVSSTTCTLC
jgi:hypothetical protein